MMLGFDSTSTTNGEAAWKTFCDMDSDLDAIRGVTMKKYTGKCTFVSSWSNIRVLISASTAYRLYSSVYTRVRPVLYLGSILNLITCMVQVSVNPEF
mgnify:CR=1 FL=1